MAAAFGSGAMFSLVSGMGGPNQAANAVTSGLFFALVQGGLYQVGIEEKTIYYYIVPLFDKWEITIGLSMLETLEQQIALSENSKNEFLRKVLVRFTYCPG